MFTAIGGVVTYVSPEGAMGTSAVPTLRSSYDRFDGDEHGLMCKDESLAKQSFKEECDINVIVQRFGLDYQVPQGLRLPTYGDFTGVTDFHSAANAIALARESFDLLPAHLRTRFNHDPGSFVAFCSDDANRAEAEKLGLVMPKPPKVDAPVASPGAPSAGAPAAAPSTK